MLKKKKKRKSPTELKTEKRQLRQKLGELPLGCQPSQKLGKIKEVDDVRIIKQNDHHIATTTNRQYRIIQIKTHGTDA